MNKNNLNKLFMLSLSNLFVLLTILTLSTNAHSREFHSLDDIIRTAHDFILNQTQTENEDIHVIVGQLDPRLRLHQCTLPLEAYNQNYEVRQGRSTVAVHCNDIKPCPYMFLCR